MPHALLKPAHDSPYDRPLLATLRYRCACANREVLTIQTVLPHDIPEEQFVWTMRQLWRDLRFEAEQHLKQRPPDVE